MSGASIEQLRHRTAKAQEFIEDLIDENYSTVPSRPHLTDGECQLLKQTAELLLEWRDAYLQREADLTAAYMTGYEKGKDAHACCKHGTPWEQDCAKCYAEFVASRASQPCPHGNNPADCGACDVASDFEYDACRESR